MALQHVLSAMRTLILDTETIPADVSARTVAYQNWFPELSAHETEDLAKIQPEKLKIYTATIFTGEAKIVRNHFKMCTAILESAWPAVYNQAFRPGLFARKVHSLRPWQSYETQAFVNTVRDVLCQDLPGLLEHTPALADLARLEALVVEIKRHPDEALRDGRLGMQEVFASTVEDLLALNVHVPGSHRFAAFDFDVVSSFQRFHGNDRKLAVPETASKTYAIGYRSAGNQARWHVISESFYAALATHAVVSLSEIAGQFVAAYPDTAEADLFALFIEELRALLERQAIVLCKK